ncbi:MAG: diguanylate cyclase [Deltaproteobacteria bacterium]|nr:diguanylate cyclase [Deltaproteobacteria bacterium]
MKYEEERDSIPPIVLYVSNDAAHLNMVRKALGEVGFSVVTSRSAAEARDLARTPEIDAVVCDYDMSQVDGVSLCLEMQGERVEPTPMLVVSEHWAPAVLARCLKAGLAGLHVKSEPPELLVDRVLSMIKDEGKRELIESRVAKRQVGGGTDPVTRIGTRQHFQRRLNAESGASYRDESSLSVVIIEIDRFSLIEERHNRELAEGVLVAVARLVESEMRSRDSIARFDDHTFAVVLPDTSREVASELAQRLRQLFASSEYGDVDHPISIRASLGVACRPAGDLSSVDDLVDQAVRACSAAAAMGGDRVVCDDTLTGRPLILLVGSPEKSCKGLMAGFLECKVEVRVAPSTAEARSALESIPVAMIVATDYVGNDSGVDFLAWARGKFPGMRRVLVAENVTSELMEKAVNQAAIHHFLALPCDMASLPTVLEQMIFT